MQCCKRHKQVKKVKFFDVTGLETYSTNKYYIAYYRY